MRNFIILICISFHFLSFSQTPKTYSEWENLFTERISEIDEIEGIYKTTWYVSKYLDGNLLVKEQSKDWNDSKPYTVILKVDNGYKRFSVHEKYSLEDDVIIKTFDGSRFIKKSAPIDDNTYRENPEIHYANGQFYTKYTLTYSETLNDYEGIYYDKKVNKKELEILARRTKIHFEKESIKIFPTKDMIIESRQRKLKTSASGFAITTNGIIVTNYHVVENAESIKVKGINSNFDKSYDAKVVVFDKNNDIALLKLTESETMKLSIPFTLRTELAKVGESIYALGYPLRASMGDEIKLTNGIISSKTGFQGDATTYQVSAPVQPGNSGGPLFDN
ncbi:serine protease [uncultured Draconibacterium sp.]|uniref:S1C family serine protease n=1 Tax=uncultured Draconibacterium sp. TaxID=1573823 RepID=UPI0032169AEE